MRNIILEGKRHVVSLLHILDNHTDLQFDAMIDAREYVESLDKWQSLLKEKKTKDGESAWELIGTFDLSELIEPEGDDEDA